MEVRVADQISRQSL